MKIEYSGPHLIDQKHSELRNVLEKPQTNQNTHLDISIIIATSRRPESLAKTLSSFCGLVDHGLNWEVILIDNGNDTKTSGIAEQFMEKYPLTFVTENRAGKSFALNAAIPHIRGSLSLLTDDDVIAHPNWLVNTWKGTKRWPHHALFGGRILPKFPPGTVPRDLSHRLIRGAYVIADWEKEEGEYKASMVWGPNMAVSTEIFRLGFTFNTTIGPTQRDYVMGQDTEFACRLEESGYTPVYLPHSLVYHQIRPEQLTVNWLYQRVVRSGRSFAFVSGLPATPLLFGIPRYMYRLLIEAGFDYALAFFQTRKTRHTKRMLLWYRWGMFSQYAKGVQKKRMMKF